MVPNSKHPLNAKKPRKDFPLFPHQRGYWAKKVKGKLHYFGKISDDPRGDAALIQWLEEKDDLLAGRTPRSAREGLTVAMLCNHFLTAKDTQLKAGNIKPRTFGEYLQACQLVVDSFGKNRLVEDLAVADFELLGATIIKKGYGVHRRGNCIQRVRTLFKYGTDAGLISVAIKFGPDFKKPSNRLVRAHRQKRGKRMLEAAAIRILIQSADQPLKAMIFLGINCGYGNQDCGELLRSAVDLKAGWLDFPRPKTAIERRCPLWPETIDALRDALMKRPKAQKPEDDRLVFITKYGHPWPKETTDNPVTKEFRKLIDSVDTAQAKKAKTQRIKSPDKIYRPGIGFYALRKTFATIAGESTDQVAVNHIMGHADNSMAGIYRERISDKRLHNVVTVVRRWLFPDS